MKANYFRITPERYIDLFYDRSLRLWTGRVVDNEGNQIGLSIYDPKRERTIIETTIKAIESAR